jgi:hypothetical protein
MTGGIFRQVYWLTVDNISKDSFRKPHDQFFQAPVLFFERFRGEFHSHLVFQTLGPQRWLIDHSTLPQSNANLPCRALCHHVAPSHHALKNADLQFDIEQALYVAIAESPARRRPWHSVSRDLICRAAASSAHGLIFDAAGLSCSLSLIEQTVPSAALDCRRVDWHRTKTRLSRPCIGRCFRAGLFCAWVSN